MREKRLYIIYYSIIFYIFSHFAAFSRLSPVRTDNSNEAAEIRELCTYVHTFKRRALRAMTLCQSASLFGGPIHLSISASVRR